MTRTRKIAKDFPHYFSLIGILVFGLLLFSFFSYSKSYQVAVMLATASAYVVWGIVHHAIHGDLHTSVVIEYIAFAALGVTLALFLIFRA